MVLLMIFVGGWTRLTDSGLSIVEWKPVTGIIPPMTEEAWHEEFSSYKTSPEYQKLNKNFALEDFKDIFWLEFIHRILGRLTGLLIIIPAIFFGMKMPYVWMSLLVILQGFMGWYMVKSGLVDNPYVSHYRLAAHLMLAILLYSVILWQIFKSWIPAFAGMTSVVGITSCYNFARITLGFIYIQIFLGALVAGLDAGLIYNEYPLMGGRFVPAEVLFSHRIFDDATSVQFLHRCMAYVVAISSIALGWRLLPKAIGWWVIGTVLMQFLLGVLTLLYSVPIKLALAHQLFAVLLLSMVLYLVFKTKEN